MTPDLTQLSDPANGDIAGQVAGALLISRRTEFAALRAGESDPGGWWGAPEAGSLIERTLAGDAGIDPEQEVRRALAPLASAGLIDVRSVSVSRPSVDEIRVTVSGIEVTL